jgi:hypothetical protein
MLLLRVAVAVARFLIFLALTDAVAVLVVVPSAFAFLLSLANVERGVSAPRLTVHFFNALHTRCEIGCAFFRITVGRGRGDIFL